MSASPQILGLVGSWGVHALDDDPLGHGAPELTCRLRARGARHGHDSAHAVEAKGEMEAAFSFRPGQPVSS